MKLAIVLALAALAAPALSMPFKVVRAGAPARPNIASTFYTEYQVEVDNQGHHASGYGKWAVDANKQAEAEDFDAQGDQGHIRGFRLALFPQHKLYSIDGDYHYARCEVSALNQTFQAPFGWVALANYVGQRHGLDIWEYLAAGGVNLTVGVSARDPNTPIFQAISANGNHRISNFQNFAARTPDANDFVVPSKCASSTLVAHTVRAPSPPRPNIASTFYTNYQTEVDDQGHHASGYGHWAVDASLQAESESFDVQGDQGHKRGFRLALFPQKQIYTIEGDYHYARCEHQALNQTFQAPFAWVSQANYVGQRHDLDIWEFLAAGGVNLTVGVYSRDPNTPIFQAVTANGARRISNFQSFQAQKPDPRDFEVPSECKH